MRKIILGVFALFALVSGMARGDILLYKYPGAKKALTMQGKVTVNPGRTVSFRHPKFGHLYFGLEDVRYYRVPTTRSIALKQLRMAKNDPDACLEAARWALHHGLFAEFNKAASSAWRLAPDHPTVMRLAALKRKMKRPLPESKDGEKKLLRLVKRNENMRFMRSEHFLLMHDCQPLKKKKRANEKLRAEERLELLEVVYESFMLKYCFEGLELDVPEKKLLVILFADREDFLAFSKSIGVPAERYAGYFHKPENFAVFYDQATNEGFAKVRESIDALQRLKEQAIRMRAANTKNIARMANTLEMLIEVERENQDIEVVSHEVTHQMAGNTGLQPNDAAVPTWAAEGVATYFESPKEAAWAGIGTVNERRLKAYRALEGNRRRSNIDFIVSNQIFMRAGSDKATIHAYGQAWALTHFLMAHHFDKLIEYYKLAAKRKLDDCKKLKPKEYCEQCQADFDAVFGKNKSALNREWRAYMNSLKTDLERVIDEDD